MDSWNFDVLLVFSSLQNVRDWSGILLETEAGDGGGSEGGKRYSGKPDGDSRNAKKRKTIRLQDYKTTSFWSDVVM